MTPPPAVDESTRTAGAPQDDPDRTAGPTPPDSGFGPGDSRPATLQSGLLLGGRYRIVERIGRGGMGEVYRADDLLLDQVVALKLLPAEFAASEAGLARLLKEVRVARQVAHPNVCRVYDVEQAEGLRFLTMEYIEGEDLASRLRRQGRLRPDEATSLARQLCAGLEAAHERGVLHRDLKPSNVILDDRGLARILDFGIAEVARVVSGTAAREGTPLYMAPEQLAGGEVTLRSDLYALGLVLYEACTGLLPNEEARTLEELTQARRVAPPAPSGKVPGIDRRLSKAILRCLESDPARRPPSARALAESLPGGATSAEAHAAAQRRADRIAAFRAEAAELRRAGLLPIAPADLNAVEKYHAEILTDLVRRHDVDVSEAGKQLSLGMRAIALIGAVALSASAFYFFYSLWGLISLPAQVGLLAAGPTAGLVATLFLARWDRSGYFATMSAMFSVACLILNTTVLWSSLNLVPSPYHMLPWWALGLILAYRFGLRLPLAVAILSLAFFLDAWICLRGGLWWTGCMHRPENYLVAAAATFSPLLVPHRRNPLFPMLYRTLGMCLLFFPVLFLAHNGHLSYIPVPSKGVQIGYQLLGFAASAAAIWLGLRQRWKEVVYGGAAFFLLMLYFRFVEWWWDWMPKSVFFLIVSLVAILVLLILRRLRGVMSELEEVRS